MDFTIALYIEKLPGASVKKVVVGGIEQRCLVIPMDPDVFHTTKTGKKFLQVSLREREQMDSGGSTHKVYYSYPNPEKLKFENQGTICGKCYLSKPIEMNEDRTNNSTFQGYGTICLDDIDEDAVFTNSFTGKKYVRIGIRPRLELDRGKNTHDIFIDPRYGASKGRKESLLNGYDAPLLVIGKLREYTDEESPSFGTLATESQEMEANPQEESKHREIDGMEF